MLERDILNAICLCVQELPDHKLRKPIKALLKVYDSDLVYQKESLNRMMVILSELEKEEEEYAKEG